MQRLKGLTTGSLPTFVDAGSNFASSEITEDNFLDQLTKANKEIVFMGDDTWESLFPGRFKRAFSFPSFNVQDLHTVDNGVLQHLIPELRKKDWNLLIAHFLGVDHCGHRFGPYHPAMADKLTQMDTILRSVIKELDDDTVLFVMGDHGMTRTGDHGGDSTDEVDAALFVYSPSQITATQDTHLMSVSQVDLVPTVSLLLGIPIPYSNLGTIITDLFNYCPWWKMDNKENQVFHTVKALRINAYQVRSYINTYRTESDEFPQLENEKLESLFNQAEAEIQSLVTYYGSTGDGSGMLNRLVKLEETYRLYLEGVKEMCKNIWAKFDISTMILGMTIIIAALLWNLFIHLQNLNHEATLSKMFYMTAFGLFWSASYLTFLWFMDLKPEYLILSIISGASIIIMVVGLIHLVLTHDKKTTDKSKTVITEKQKKDSYIVKSTALNTWVAVGVLGVYCAGLFSNSYIVNEETMVLFLLQTCLFMNVFETMKRIAKQISPTKVLKRKSRFLDVIKNLRGPRSMLCILLVCVSVLLKIAEYFQTCREEQTNCEISNFLQPLSALVDVTSGYKNMRYFFSVMCIGLTACMLYVTMKHQGNLNSDSVSAFCVRYLVPLSAICICLHWALHSLPPKVIDSLPVWQRVALPRVVYLCLIFTISSIATQPLFILLVRRNSNVQFESDQSIPTIYNHMKMNWRTHFGTSEDKPPMVYGLATVYSAVILAVVGSYTLFLAMLLGDGLSPSICIAATCGVLFLEMYASRQRCDKEEESQDNKEVPLSAVVTWILMSWYFFYTTGHQATVPAIRWDAAFNGFHGDFNNNLIPALLIHHNTLASQILFTVMLPLLIFWPYSEGTMTYLFSQPDPTGNESMMKGEVALNENRKILHIKLFKLFNAYILLNGIKLLSCVCCAALHRRHLMVWKIFAPRFVYEGASFLTVTAYSIIMYLFVLRIDSALTRWVTKLEKET